MKEGLQNISRCAIYTRKSSEEGLDRELNSLEAQRDTCSAYIRSQRHKGWVELPQHYDDGGYSGGSLVRPGLQKLLSDIEAGRVDVVLIYKIDRLTRSLLDFVRLIDTLERFQVSFVSITQAFDTSDSMGRLILNVLLTFAQFERELMGDRIRDKVAALKRRGKYTGGRVPFGYDKVEGRLVPHETEADIVRQIYERYLAAPSGNQLLKELQSEGLRNKTRVVRGGKIEGGNVFGPGILHRVLTNPLYLGKIVLGEEWIDGEHEALVTRELWDKVQALRAQRHGDQIPRQPTGSLLLRILHDTHGRKMNVETMVVKGKRYRHYVTERTRQGRREGLKLLRTDAAEVERLAATALRTFLCDRPAVGRALASLGLYDDDVPRAIAAGPIAARRIARMDDGALRHLFVAIFRRAELDRERLRLMVSCHELSRLLAWDGMATFKAGAQVPSRYASHIHLIEVPAAIVRETRVILLPLRPLETGEKGQPDPKLVKLLDEAREAQRIVLARRESSVAELAREHGYGPSFFSRLVKLNYLAPDIVAAILDGRHPAGLTRRDLAFSSMPLDWAQQRQLLGFPPFHDVGAVRVRQQPRYELGRHTD